MHILDLSIFRDHKVTRSFFDHFFLNSNPYVDSKNSHSFTKVRISLHIQATSRPHPSPKMATKTYVCPQKRQQRPTGSSEHIAATGSGVRSANWRNIQSASIPTAQSPHPAATPNQQTRRTPSPSSSKAQGLAGVSLLPGHIVFIPDAGKISSTSRIYRELGGSDPFCHPAVITTVGQDTVELFVLTSFSRKAAQDSGS